MVNEGGKIKLGGNINIPEPWRFYDTYTIVVSSQENNWESKARFRVTFDADETAATQLKREVDKFNRNAPKVADATYMHGLYYNESFKVESKIGWCNVLTKLPSNEVTRKYSGQWNRGYRFTEKGLQELIFRHTPTSVSLASRNYW